MATTIVKKNKFKDDGTGRLVLGVKVKPKTVGGTDVKVDGGIKDEILTSNLDVATGEKDPADPMRMLVVWAGPGSVDLTVKADADLDVDEEREVTGVLSLKLEEEEAETLEFDLEETA